MLRSLIALSLVSDSDVMTLFVTLRSLLWIWILDNPSVRVSSRASTRQMMILAIK